MKAVLLIFALLAFATFTSAQYDCSNSSWETFLYVKINNTGMPVANVTVSVVMNTSNVSQLLNHTTLQVMKKGTSTTYPFYLARGLKSFVTEWFNHMEVVYFRVAEEWSTGEVKEFQLCAANSSIAATVESVENNKSAFAFYNNFQDYTIGDQLMTCNVLQSHQISACLNDGKCLSTNMPTGGIGNYCENTSFFTDSRFMTELIDTTRPFTYHEITYLPNTNNLRMDYMFSLRNSTTGSITGSYPYGTQDITINGVDFEPNNIATNQNIESWSLIFPNQSAMWSRFIPSNDYNYGTHHDISFTNATITGYRISSKNEGGGTPGDALHDEIWLAYSLEKYIIEYNATGNIFGAPATPPTPPSNFTPTGVPILNYSSGNYSSQLTILVSNVSGATGYVWLQNGSVMQNLSTDIFLTTFIFNNTYNITVYGYNGSYMGLMSDSYVYNFIEAFAGNITPNATPSNITSNQLSYKSCSDKLAGTLMLWLFVLIGIILFIIGFTSSNIPISAAGSVVVIFASLFVGACSGIVGYLFAGGGVALFLASLSLK